MKKPYKYYVLCNKTKKMLWESNEIPIRHQLTGWVESEKAGWIRLELTRTAYVDTRYEAKLRLFNWVNYGRKGLPIPKYDPFKDSEVGKSVPILGWLNKERF